MMSFLRHSDLKLEELEATELASLGNLLCGLSPMEISRLDPKHLRSDKKERLKSLYKLLYG